MAASDLLLLFLLLQAVFFTFTATCSHHRHLLHQPFFPLGSTPPPTALPPVTSSLPPQLQPKQPFSATPSTPQKPFFQTFRSSPPPPAPAVLGSFPANITSILFPRHPSPEKPFSRKLAAIAIAVSLLSAALIAAVAALVLYYRRHRQFSVPDKSSRAEGLRLYPPNTATSDGGSSGSGGGGASHKPRSVGSNTSSEFLYLGTLVNSRGVDDESVANSGNAGTGIGIGVSTVPATAYRKLGSPELTPLPPLPRNVFKQSSGNAEVVGLSSSSDDDDDEEEFFSPRASLGAKDSPKRTASSSSKLFDGLGADNYGITSFNSRTPSYTRSTSASHSDSVSSSPLLPLNTTPKPKSPDLPVDYPAPSRPPPPPPPQQPRTPSVSSSPVRISNVSATSNGSGSPHPVVPMKLPPPPPPLPPQRFWEAPATPRVAPEPISGPPVHVAPSRPVVLQNLAPISPAQDQSSQSDGSTETPRPKLKPLHWDKVRASSDRVMVWDQIKTSSFQLNEEMIETLFTVNGPSPTPKDSVRRQVLPATQQENRVLDPKKSQNIAILLRALNVTIDEVCEALLEGHADTLGTELLESLLKMAPTKEEERKLKEFKDETPIKLGPAEKFLKAVLDIPFAFKRVEAMLYITNFDSEVQYLFKSFETLEAACEELRASRMFLKLLEAVLKTGNRMNVGTNRGDAHAFKLDTLLKLADVKGADGKTTLLHFVVQEIIKAEGYRQTSATNISEIEQSQESPLQDVEFRKLGLQVVSSLCGELTSVKKAAAMDSDVLSSEVMKLARGISKIEEVVTLNESSQKFSESINGFLKKAKEEIGRIQAQEKVAFSMVKEITEYFHGNSSKEEAHRFRIFMVVRDFLSELDKVCKEVGKINERTIVGAARSQVPAPPFHDGLYFR